MKRRDFVTALGVGAAAAAITGCAKESAECTEGTQGAGEGSSTASQETIKWKLVTTWPKNFPGLGSAPENFARIVNEMSAGRLQVKVHGAGEIVPAFEVFDAVSQGGAQMGHGAAYYWSGKHPASPFFTAVPFGMTAQEMNGWLHYGGGMDLWQQLYDGFNLVPFAGGSTGVQMAGWFNKEINSIEDLQGLKMRIPGLAGEVLKRVGGEPVTIPGGELYTSLQTGVIDATEWVGPYNDLTLGFYKIAKYYYYPGWHEPGAMLEFIVNKEAYAALPDDLKAIVKYASRAVNQDMLDEYTARNNKALKELVENHGVQVKALPEDVLKKLKETSEIVVSESVQGNDLGQKIYASFREFEANVASYHRISEQAFLETRSL